MLFPCRITSMALSLGSEQHWLFTEHVWVMKSGETSVLATYQKKGNTQRKFKIRQNVPRSELRVYKQINFLFCFLNAYFGVIQVYLYVFHFHFAAWTAGLSHLKYFSPDNVEQCRTGVGNPCPRVPLSYMFHMFLCSSPHDLNEWRLTG